MAGKKPGPKQGKKPRNRLQIESDNEAITEMCLKGYTIRQMEKHLRGQVSRETIRKSVLKLQKEWASETK
jgi:hypothetical protein